jgi:hypothetical protein
MALAIPTGAVCPECTNTGYVPESEDEVTGCCEPGCPYWAEHDATQGTLTFELDLPRVNALLERQADGDERVFCPICAETWAPDVVLYTTGECPCAHRHADAGRERDEEFRRAFLAGELPFSHPIYRNTASELCWDGTIGAMV